MEITIDYFGEDLKVEYDYIPEQKGGLETEPIPAHLEITYIEGDDYDLDIVYDLLIKEVRL